MSEETLWVIATIGSAFIGGLLGGLVDWYGLYEKLCPPSKAERK